MGRPPKDLDLVTDAPTSVIRASVPEGHFVGAHFEVCCLRGRGMQAELASFRQDGPYVDGRRPLYTKPATLEEDAHRRDFTVNALYQAWPDGDLIDCVGGLEDLEKKVLRAVGRPFERFREDALRCLRAVRFVAELGFKLDPHTKEDLARAAPFLERISVERQEVELTRLLLAEGVDLALREMQATGLLIGPLPEPPESIPKEVSLEDWGWAVWLKDSLPQAQASLKYLRFSKPRSRRLLIAIESLQNLAKLAPTGILRVLQSDARPLFYALVQHFQPSFFQQVCGWQESLEKLQSAPVCDGALLLRLGWQPSPRFKEVLQEVRLKQFEGQLQTVEALEDWLKSRGKA
jgi:tRNA nucleotidyltransferase/poly(A) polymerase